ncbi:hypothetical protein [Mycolicibacter senuensis]|uniref:hypothetical protein n=1 Tax=Mycolicibacter senuensis TaxID=386913 RepID=UPI000DCCD58C|nr:hypothetical protein [Mycolicibacter senuensis]RAV00258.1 hypothetical protein DQP56_09715 [Mycolicibacter senuensis]
MTHPAEQLQTLITRCEQFRGAKAPDGYRDSLALCIVDSVQSTGVKYSSVEKVVDRYRVYRRAQGGDPNRDGVRELLATFEELRVPDGWAEAIGNWNRTSTRGGMLKAEAIRDAGTVLTTEGVVKPDRMICRFVADSLTLPRKGITLEFAGAIVTAAAKDIEMSPIDLDHAIWQWQRVRK